MEYKYFTKSNLSSYLYNAKNIKYVDMLLHAIKNLMMNHYKKITMMI